MVKLGILQESFIAGIVKRLKRPEDELNRVKDDAGRAIRKTLLKAQEALIAWTPAREPWLDWTASGQIKVGPLLPDRYAPDWTKPYACTGGACETRIQKMRGMKSVAQLFIDFHTIVVRDGLDPKHVHEAFLNIKEYRERISPDIDGALNKDVFGF